MKISPEPLHPLRTWRELWHADPVSHGQSSRKPTRFRTSDWHQSKRPAFHWLTQMVNHDTE